MKVKVFRPVGGLTYRVVGQDTQLGLAAGLNTFATSIPVKAGDVLGVNSLNNGAYCVFAAPGENRYFSGGDQPTGGQLTFTTDLIGQRVNVRAEVLPTSEFTIGETTRNKKKGTATLALQLPGPGEVTVAGKGVKEATAAGAHSAASVPAPGEFSVTIKAKGKKRKRLNENGRVKVTPSITYTPTGGNPGTLTTKLKLKKKS
jgi:hypothetical protein